MKTRTQIEWNGLTVDLAVYSEPRTWDEPGYQSIEDAQFFTEGGERLPPEIEDILWNHKGAYDEMAEMVADETE